MLKVRLKLPVAQLFSTLSQLAWGTELFGPTAPYSPRKEISKRHSQYSEFSLESADGRWSGNLDR